MLHKSSLQHLPSKTALLSAMLLSIFLLLLATRSNYLPHQNLSPDEIALHHLPPRRLDVKTGPRPPPAHIHLSRPPPPQDTKLVPVAPDWIRIPPASNFTRELLQLLAENGSRPCHEVSTAEARLFGLPRPEDDHLIRLRAGLIHELKLVAYDNAGRKRCSGGDYFETDLSGPGWKSRPPIADLGDGSYSIRLQVHPSFVGVYNFKIILLYSNFHALHRRPERWSRDELILDVLIKFEPPERLRRIRKGIGSHSTVLAPDLRQCSAEDLRLQAWTGRWTQAISVGNCSINNQGRFLCLDLNEACISPWCEGSLGALESNGWVYSAHCSFQIFQEESAWKCLDQKWIFFWGDSNHVDTIRNLLNFVLGLVNVTEVPRRFDRIFVRPLNSSQSVRITSLFNGHANESLNHQGLFSLSDPLFREQIRYYFSGDSVPDIVIMNSGLHDGMYWKYVHHFVEEGVNKATKFWHSIMKKLQGREPKVIYRTTIATAAWARKAAFNPHKMEVFNQMFVEKLQKSHVASLVVDDFDLTYPWHFDNNCSDGVHYGKPPALGKWYGQIGHQYFVDLMLVHILLHTICMT